MRREKEQPDLREGLLLKISILALTTSAAAQSSLQRGDYLVNAVMACDGYPRIPAALLWRSASPEALWDVAEYTVKGSNITPDPDTGIGLISMRWFPG
jgi:hypothetical protein